MSFRLRLLLACLPLAIAPLAFFGIVARGEVVARLDAQHAERVAALADVIEADLARESAAVAARLDRLADVMAADNRFRLAVLQGAEAGTGDRAYILDYAARAMPLAGLDVLRIQDEEGRVLSSGHFRNEYDAVDPALPDAIWRAGVDAILVDVATAAGTVLALARARDLRLGARTLTLVGGVAIDEGFLERLARGTGLEVRLARPGPTGATFPVDGPTDPPGAEPRTAGAPSPPGHSRSVAVRFAGAGPDTTAWFTVHASAAPLVALRRGMDRWLLVAAAAAAGLALLLALAASAGLSRPLAELARKAGRVRLDRVNDTFATRRGDEIGDLSRVLDRMTDRLRSSAVRLREAERRATVGDMARQVNHDIRNGLIPIRNVVDHLSQLARERPDELTAVFRERQQTLDSSVDYLQSLAANYARLSPRLDREPCDLNAVVREVVGEAAGLTRAGGQPVRLATDLGRGLPPVLADPVALRRILENLVVNAVDSIGDGGGRVLVATRLDADGDAPRVRLTVSDTGRGMSAEERARIFDDFYTTKRDGGGLGLSIVRRLVGDLDGRITVESAPGEGSRFLVGLPAAESGPARGGDLAAAAPERDGGRLS